MAVPPNFWISVSLITFGLALTAVSLKIECEAEICDDINELQKEIKELKQEVSQISWNNRYYQPEQLVFTFSHSDQADEARDQEVAGFEHANRYYHIITPIEQSSTVMYRFQLKGYDMEQQKHWI